MPETRTLLEAAITEVVAVAHGRGVALPQDTVELTLSFIDSLPAEATASMQRDIVEGRPSELESQTGAIVRLAAGVESVDLSDITAHLDQIGVARQKWPEELRVATDFPRTASGKIRKVDLRRGLRDD